MSEEVITQEIEEETALEVTQNVEGEIGKDKTSIDIEPPVAISIDDIVSGKPPVKKGVDTTPKWAKDRFDELTAKIYERDERIKELETLQTTLSDRPIPPAESDFIESTDYKKAQVIYEDRLDEWKRQHRRNEEIQENFKRELAENLVKFNEKAEKMKEKYPDFDKVTNEPIFTSIMRDEIVASEYGPEIGYFLAKNPVEALKLVKLSPTKIAKEIGKLEVKFSQATQRFASGAPPPITPIEGDDTPVKDPSKMSDDEWYKWNQTQKLKKLKLGG